MRSCVANSRLKEQVTIYCFALENKQLENLTFRNIHEHNFENFVKKFFVQGFRRASQMTYSLEKGFAAIKKITDSLLAKNIPAIKTIAFLWHIPINKNIIKLTKRELLETSFL